LALPAQAADVTKSVQIRHSGFVLDPITDTLDIQVTVTNQATALLWGPLRLVIESIQPAQIVHFNTYGSTESGKSFVEVPLVDGVLAPGASATALAKFINSAELEVTRVSFTVEGQLMDAAGSAQIRVQALAPKADGAQGAALGAGYAVEVDGVRRGVTDAAGRLTLTVPLTAQGVSVTNPPNWGGSDILQDLVAGQVRDVQLVVGDGKEVYGAGRLRFDQAQQGILPRSAPRITLRFLDFERPVPVTIVNHVKLVDAGDDYVSFESVLSLTADGTLSATPAAFFAAVGNRSGRMVLQVTSQDEDGVTHQGDAVFYLRD